MTEEELPEMEQQEPNTESPLIKELEEYKDKHLRLLAEMENTRKRLQKEKQEMMRFAVENVISDFLIPMDNLENALNCTAGLSAETLNWVKGFEMILSQFKDVLVQNGVHPFSSTGSTFDPNLHEAVEVEEGDLEGIILQEYTRGYTSGPRTLRPARVKVSKKKE